MNSNARNTTIDLKIVETKFGKLIDAWRTNERKIGSGELFIEQ